MTSSPRIALFGGTFDPPHKGHLYCINAVANSGLVDEIWVVPVGDDRLDKKSFATGEHRSAMVELLLSSLKIGIKALINTLQLEGKLKGSYTIDLVDELKRQNPENEYFFVVGADKLIEIANWKSPDRLRNEVSFLVIPRPGSENKEKTQSSNLRTIFLELPTSKQGVDVSSSAIRRRVLEGRDISDSVTSEVAEYIEKQALYRD